MLGYSLHIRDSLVKTDVSHLLYFFSPKHIVQIIKITSLVSDLFKVEINNAFKTLKSFLSPDFSTKGNLT